MLQINLRNIIIILLVVVLGKIVSDFTYQAWKFRIPGL